MLLLQLPNELLLLISRDLKPADLNSFLQTSRRLASLLTPPLHRIAIQDRNLLKAIQKGYAPLVKLLLENERGGKDFLIGSALHWAAHYGHLEIVELILDMGVKISLKDISGESALFWAVRAGRVAIFLLLLAKGADVHEKGRMGISLLQVAKESGSVELERVLTSMGKNEGL